MTAKSIEPSRRAGPSDPSLGDLSRAELADLLSDEPAYRIDQIWDGLYRQRRPLAELTNVPKSLRAAVGELLPPALTLVRSQRADRGATTKHLWSLRDGRLVESVLMRYRSRVTLCISSQAGCAMGCSFCATGQVGFDRNLSVGEITEQVLATLQQGAVDPKTFNIVFMGMGEPLANYEAVAAAIERFHHDMGIGARHITVSTVGLVPGIVRLTNAKLPINLAVSLHAANDRLRNRIAPINRTYPLAELARALDSYRRAKRRRISLEWAMIGGLNDSDSDAAEFAGFARPLAAHVNLIPLNPTPGYRHEPSSPAQIQHFAAELVSRGVNATIRANRGTSIDAACGQLRADKPFEGTAADGTAAEIRPSATRPGSARARAAR